MPFIDMGTEFGDTKEPELAPEGREYDLICKEIEENKDLAKGKNNIRVMILFESEDYAPMFHYIGLPIPEKDQRNDEDKGHAPGTTTRTKMLMLKRFLTAFNVPFAANGFNPQDIVGSRARLAVTQETYKRDDGSISRSNRVTIPPLPSEDVKTGGGEPEKKKAKA